VAALFVSGATCDLEVVEAVELGDIHLVESLEAVNQGERVLAVGEADSSEQRPLVAKDEL
jgi:hypothetical protein